VGAKAVGDVLLCMAEVVKVGARPEDGRRSPSPAGSSWQKMNSALALTLGLQAVGDGSETGHCIGTEIGDDGVILVAWAQCLGRRQ
jgi:hypothetical protein